MDGTQSVASREAVLAQYYPIRASIRCVLRQAVSCCRKPDFDRAAKHLDLWDQKQRDDRTVFDMLCDIALMERNQRGKRVYDWFLQDGAVHLDLGDHEIARRMAAASFSIFQVTGWHDAAGVWLDDLLVAERRLWLVDEGLEASAPEGLAIAMRVFDAGPFHAGFGIVVMPDPELIEFCAGAASRGQPLPVRRSLAAAFYGEAIARAALNDPDDIAGV
ncbi:hypothetical protein ASG63_20495 [Methylobacterium sp. Leaf94]|uniref:hypothetical protein n=1 Tax=Methylobacterium sp. Leaf94 TaxID=1736250 RepID=UPI00070177B5|nr:hypothetical protein [Methylobacterium sp. Leaf94]KQU25492.1 hypothetical protein ASG63_20495 [Methylobacterium sp. Leaf94]